MIKIYLRKIDSLKLKYKIALAILIIIVLILIIFDVFILHFQRTKLIQNLEERNIALAKNWATDAVDALLLRDLLQLDRQVTTVKQTPLCLYAYILDSTGKVVAHTDRHYLGKVRSLPAVKTNTAFNKEEHGQHIREYYIPITIDQEVLGFGVFAIDKKTLTESLEEALKGLRYHLFFTSTFLFALAIFFSSFLANLLTKRLSMLKEKMRLVQRGNFNVEILSDNVTKCWEKFGCSYQDCPASGKTRCWTIPNTVGNKGGRKIKACQECSIYKESCGDEIGELTEVFNQMMTALRVNLKKLEKANVEKCRLERLSLLGQMSARVAHEIKNPLNAIRGAANYLKRNFGGEILNEFLRIIEEETERLNDIVTDFLNFSKPTPPVKVLSNLNLLVEDTVRLVNAEIREKRLNLVLDTDSSLKSFKFDYAKLKQALLNLLVNAIEETEPGGVIEVKTQRQDNYALLSVRDTGKGITPELLEDIFKPFFTTKTRGSGLGLAIVEQIVKEHQGEISIKSAVGKGSVFTITLPVEEK